MHQMKTHTRKISTNRAQESCPCQQHPKKDEFPKKSKHIGFETAHPSRNHMRIVESGVVKEGWVNSLVQMKRQTWSCSSSCQWRYVRGQDVNCSSTQRRRCHKRLVQYVPYKVPPQHRKGPSSSLCVFQGPDIEEVWSSVVDAGKKTKIGHRQILQ